jgi:hypothetical protein
VLTDAASVSAAEGLTEITGGLSTSSRLVDELTGISLPDLQAIGGSVMLDSTSIVDLALPNLARIGGSVSIRFNARLVEVDLRRLAAVDGTLSVIGNPTLSRLRLDSLESVLSLEVEGDALAGCEMAELATRLPAATSVVGNPDCECTSSCGWLEAQCR